MKVPPLNLNPDMNRVGMALAPFSPDLLWRYPISLPQSASAPPSSPLLDVKTQMPNQLAQDPRMWSREDVSTFLKWFEREFELPVIDITKFCMNGKALCMLNKSDLADRAPGAGDILHNTLQFLLRDAPIPQSPLTPHHPLLSPSPLTPTQPWTLASTDFHNIGHLLQPGGSVTLSPAPSEQSGGSPRHPENGSAAGYQHSSAASTGSGHSGSHSDSEDSSRDDSSPQRSPLPPHTAATTLSAQALASLKHLTDYQRAAAAAACAAAAAAQHNSTHDDSMHSQHHTPQLQPQSQSLHQQPQHTSPPQPQPQPPLPGDEPVETGTNGRLLWDFLQQLLNDVQQRYSRYIAWKNRETGVFKIVDPPGLARLWGIQKNHLSMNYDKMSRALRYYYRVNILRKVQGERHCYQFLRNPSELKSIKNISLLRGAPLPSPHKREPQTSSSSSNNNTTSTPMEEDEGPTDLSMASLLHQYQPSYQQNPPSHTDRKDMVEPTFQTPSLMDTKPQNLSVDRASIETGAVKTEEYIEESYD